MFGNALMPNVWDARTIVIEAARSPHVPRFVGVLLLAASCAVVLSTAMVAPEGSKLLSDALKSARQARVLPALHASRMPGCCS